MRLLLLLLMPVPQLFPWQDIGLLMGMFAFAGVSRNSVCDTREGDLSSLLLELLEGCGTPSTGVRGALFVSAARASLFSLISVRFFNMLEMKDLKPFSMMHADSNASLVIDRHVVCSMHMTEAYLRS